jgi:hypothetical protein
LDLGIVLDQQHAKPGRHALRRGGIRLLVGPDIRVDARQVKRYGGACTGRAVESDGAIRLPGKAVDGRQAQPGAAAAFLVVKKGSKARSFTASVMPCPVSAIEIAT